MFLLLFIFVVFITSSFAVQSAEPQLNLNNTKVYGPGLTPDKIVLPVRYIYIEAYDNDGQRITKSLGDDIEVWVERSDPRGSTCRIWYQTLDRYDGTYIGRYRTTNTCYNTSILVMYKRQHIADSPYVITDPVYSEDCYCPMESVDSWMKTMGCRDTYDQIDTDLGQFVDIDMNVVLEETLQKIFKESSTSVCNYVVKNNKIHRRCYGRHVGFSMFMDSILLSMSRKMILPDLDFFINLGDFPLSKNEFIPQVPIFSWCGSDDHTDIVLPTYDFTESTIEMMGRVTLDIFSVQSRNKVEWGAKKPIGFWRGRDAREERLQLVDLARNSSGLINASLTQFFFFREKEKHYGKEPYESFFNFFNYKYQINIDGTVAAYRFPYLIAGNSVVLKQDSPFYEHFYKELRPMVHYIPFKRNLSDLIEKMKWAIDHDEEALKISKNARKFVQENLAPKNVFCYHAIMFKKWNRKVKSKVEPREGMDFVANTDEKPANCNCQRNSHKKHDEL